jgi:hypothetical protein
MKILFLGDFSGYHAVIAQELRRRGHEVAVVSDGNKYMDTYRDITLCRHPGILGGVKYLYQFLSILPQIKGYDIVEICNSHFLDLRPGKIGYFFRRIKEQNRAICLSMCSTDYYFTRAMLEGLLRYSEYSADGATTEFAIHKQDYIDGWLSESNHLLDKEIYHSVDGAVSALYEYHKVGVKYFPAPLAYGGIGIETQNLKYNPIRRNGKLKIFLGIKRETAYHKGAYILQRALTEIEKRYPADFELKVAFNTPLKEYLKLLDEADVVADQLYSYTPSTNALQSMCLGKAVISGGEEEYYDFIGEKELRPVINATPMDLNLADTLLPILSDRNDMLRRSQEGRELVEKHNRVELVADRFLNHWEKILKHK